MKTTNTRKQPKQKLYQNIQFTYLIILVYVYHTVNTGIELLKEEYWV